MGSRKKRVVYIASPEADLSAPPAGRDPASAGAPGTPDASRAARDSPSIRAAGKTPPGNRRYSPYSSVFDPAMRSTSRPAPARIKLVGAAETTSPVVTGI